MNCLNVSQLPFVVSEWLRKHYAPEGESIHSYGNHAAVVIQRPWERQPLGVVRSDPFNDLTAASRIVLPGTCLVSTNQKPTLEPPWHVLMEELRHAAKDVSETNPVQLTVLHRNKDFVPRVGLCIDSGRTMGIRGTFPKLMTLCAESWHDVLYLSIVQEVAARFAGVEMGRMLISWESVQEKTELVDRLRNVPSTEWENGYNGRFSAVPLVSEEPEKWVNEVDMLRSGVVSLGDACIRRIVSPMMAAGAALANEDVGPRRFDDARNHLRNVIAPDWKAAGAEWIDAAWRAHG